MTFLGEGGPEKRHIDAASLSDIHYMFTSMDYSTKPEENIVRFPRQYSKISVFKYPFSEVYNAV